MFERNNGNGRGQVVLWAGPEQTGVQSVSTGPSVSGRQSSVCSAVAFFSPSLNIYIYIYMCLKNVSRLFCVHSFFPPCEQFPGLFSHERKTLFYVKFKLFFPHVRSQWEEKTPAGASWHFPAPVFIFIMK